MSRISQTFDRLRGERRGGLVTYITAGDPDLARTADVLRALDRAGADVIEVGVPFSDPIADGPAIQRASERALAAGSHLGAVLDLVAAVRNDLRAPLVIFTYLNPVVRMGLDTFADRASAAGVDGVLLLDLPIEESAATRATLDARHLDQIFLLSPTTTDSRLGEAARLGRGFLYAISRLGVTGARAAVASTARPLVERVRSVTTLPVALGFGVSRPEHVAEVLAFADAAVVGSALVNVIGETAAARGDVAKAVEDFVRWLRPEGGAS
jgi:tryptophan synthase alpha chain